MAGVRWVVYSGRTGPGIYSSWFGPGGARDQVNGFSDGCSERVSSQAEAERRLAAGALRRAEDVGAEEWIRQRLDAVRAPRARAP